jgi:dynein heavy chain
MFEEEKMLTDQQENFQETSKSKSMVALKKEQIERKELFKKAKEEAKMISSFIRLIDYLLVENFVFLAIQNCRDFLQELSKIPRKTGLFETTIYFSSSLSSSSSSSSNNIATSSEQIPMTLFAPTCEQIQNIVLCMTDDIVTCVNTVSRILYLRPFTCYLVNLITDAPQIGLIIQQNVFFQQIRKELIIKINNDFIEAQEYVKNFENVRPIYEYDKKWNLEEFSQRNHTITSLKADLYQMNTWEKELEKMRAGQTIGILHVESRKLKQNLIPMTSTKMDAMKNLVKELARNKCKTQLIEYKQRIQIMLLRPFHLKEFASYMERIQQLNLKNKQLVKNTNKCCCSVLLMVGLIVECGS